MAKKKTVKLNQELRVVNEPVAAYGERSVHIFKSFEEQEEFMLQKMAKLSPKELMDKLEELRKFFLKAYLLPNGKWKPVEKKITIKKPFI